MPIIETANDERLFNQYLGLRNAPRDTLVFGVHPNARKALEQYVELEARLSSDLDAFAEYHATVTAAVDPFIDALRAAMSTVNDTMHMVNALALASGQDAIFAIENEQIDAATYVASLQNTIATCQATIATLQQMAGG